MVVFLALVSVQCADAQQGNVKMKNSTEAQVVVFVCEHGSAKSVVAAAHFNKLARERNLNLRAVSRGTNPDAEIAPRALDGLKSDGLAVGAEKPEQLSKADVDRAIRVIAFCELPEAFHNGDSVEQWEDVPPVSEDYDKARDRMVERIRRLLDELKSAK
jgi:protein-tyrosine-phosphatase